MSLYFPLDKVAELILHNIAHIYWLALILGYTWHAVGLDYCLYSDITITNRCAKIGFYKERLKTRHQYRAHLFLDTIAVLRRQ